MNPRILTVLPTLADTWVSRRVELLKHTGCSVEAVAFLRPARAQRRPDCPVEMLGHIQPGRYLARVPRLLWSMRRVRRALRRNQVAYAFNTDMALLALIAGLGLKRPLILDIADIREAQAAEDWRGRIIRTVEKFAVNRCQLLVLTSAGYEIYYRDWLDSRTPRLIIENKVETQIATSIQESRSNVPKIEPLTDRPIRIGWFGLLRDEWSMRVLELMTRSAPHRFTVILAGIGLVKDFASRVAGNPSMTHLGAYRHPDDLADLYHGVDLVMACYPPDVPHGWSQSNRYYEACLFQRPLIVRHGCRDADNVRRLDIGMILCPREEGAAAREILNITPPEWNRWRQNMEAIPTREFAITDEADGLMKAIAEMADV